MKTGRSGKLDRTGPEWNGSDGPVPVYWSDSKSVTNSLSLGQFYLIQVGTKKRNDLILGFDVDDGK